MSDLSHIEKRKLETLLDMGSGYVLDFSNRTFDEFFLDELNIDIYDEKYSVAGTSKANRLRTFWRIESNYTVSKSILKMIDYYKSIYLKTSNDFEDKKLLIEECTSIAKRIGSDIKTEQITELENIDIKDINLELLLKSIRDSIEKNEPVFALDRLHTYSIKYIHSLCEKHGIPYDNNKPLHSCYGEYIKILDSNGLIETDMTRKILKYATSIFDRFNYVRNNQSLAHDNELLNYDESLLIYRSITSVLAFIKSIEDRLDKSKTEEEPQEPDNFLSDEDIPF